jgi:hypothetical protein
LDLVNLYVTSVGRALPPAMISLLGHIITVFYLVSSSLLQYVHHLQWKYSLGSFNLLGHTAPAQAASLLVLGPFVDFWLTNKRVDAFNYTSIVTVCHTILNHLCCLLQNRHEEEEPVCFTQASLALSILATSHKFSLLTFWSLAYSRCACLSITCVAML